MNAETLAEAMGNRCSKARYEQLSFWLNIALVRMEATTVNRVAMVLGQIRVESGGLQWMEELASGAEYEGRSSLGNTQPGDGKRFKGRGPIQVTGRANYTLLSAYDYAKGRVPTKTYFVDNPKALSLDQYSFDGLEWFWVSHGLNALADRSEVRATTRIINGGYNGYAQRLAGWNIAKSLGTAILPNQVQVLADPRRLKALQHTFNEKWLKPNKWTTRLAEDGIPGPKTDAMIKTFQRSYGLTADGIPGAATLSKIHSLWGVSI